MARVKRQRRTVVSVEASNPVKAKRPTVGSRSRKSESFVAGVGRALRLAAADARKIARLYGTPIYVWENGKVVAKQP